MYGYPVPRYEWERNGVAVDSTSNKITLTAKSSNPGKSEEVVCAATVPGKTGKFYNIYVVQKEPECLGVCIAKGI